MAEMVGILDDSAEDLKAVMSEPVHDFTPRRSQRRDGRTVTEVRRPP